MAPMQWGAMVSGLGEEAITRVAVQVVTSEVNRLFLDVVTNALGTVHNFDVTGASCDAEDPVLPLQRLRPAVTVVGTATASRDGLDLVRRLTESVPACRIVLIAYQPTRALVDRAIAVGVRGVVPTHAGLPHLIEVIRGVATGCVVLDPALVAHHGAAAPMLTEREQEVLRLTAMGVPIKDIASEVFLAPGTVRNVTSSLIKRLGGRNRYDAARIATERGWL